MKDDIKKFVDLGATRVEYVLTIEAPDEAIPAIMEALTPGVPIIE